MADNNSTASNQTAIYTECGWIAEVEILADNSDPGKFSYKLKVMRTHKPGVLGRLPDGHVFTAFADKRYMAYCDWRLTINDRQRFAV